MRLRAHTNASGGLKRQEFESHIRIDWRRARELVESEDAQWEESAG